MRRNATLFGLIAALILVLVGCGGPSFNPDFAVGTVGADGSATRIRYLGEDGAELFVQEGLPYQEAADPWCPPAVNGGVAYLAPRSQGDYGNGRVVAAIDLATGEVRELPTTEELTAPTDVSANGQAAYVCANANGVSYVGRVDLASGDIVEQQFDGESQAIVMCLAATDDAVVCGGMPWDAPDVGRGRVYVLDTETLEVRASFEAPNEPLIMTASGSDVLAAHVADPENYPGDTQSYVGVYHGDTGSYELLPVDLRHGGMSAVCVVGDVLAYADTDLFCAAGEAEIVLLTWDGQEVARVSVGTDVRQLVARGNVLYAYVGGSGEDGSIRRYRYADGALVEEGSFPVEDEECFFVR